MVIGSVSLKFVDNYCSRLLLMNISIKVGWHRASIDTHIVVGYGYGYILGPSPVPPIYLRG